MGLYPVNKQHPCSNFPVIKTCFTLWHTVKGWGLLVWGWPTQSHQLFIRVEFYWMLTHQTGLIHWWVCVCVTHSMGWIGCVRFKLLISIQPKCSNWDHAKPNKDYYAWVWKPTCLWHLVLILSREQPSHSNLISLNHCVKRRMCRLCESQMTVEVWLILTWLLLHSVHFACSCVGGEMQVSHEEKHLTAANSD